MKRVTIALLGAAVLVFCFQNCNKATFVPGQAASVESLGESAPQEVPPEETIPDTSVVQPEPSTPPNIIEGSEEEVQLTSSALNRRIHWVLSQYIDNSQAISLPQKHFFRFRLQAVYSSDPSCVASCESEYRVTGHSYCGPVEALFSQVVTSDSQYLNSFTEFSSQLLDGCEYSVLDSKLIALMKETPLRAGYIASRDALILRTPSGVELLFQAQGD